RRKVDPEDGRRHGKLGAREHATQNRLLRGVCPMDTGHRARERLPRHAGPVSQPQVKTSKWRILLIFHDTSPLSTVHLAAGGVRPALRMPAVPDANIRYISPWS